MEKIDPLYQKNANIKAQNRPFFFKIADIRTYGHTDFTKIDPFSVEFRTMMRTFYMWEWRDWASAPVI